MCADDGLLSGLVKRARVCVCVCVCVCCRLNACLNLFGGKLLFLGGCCFPSMQAVVDVTSTDFPFSSFCFSSLSFSSSSVFPSHNPTCSSGRNYKMDLSSRVATICPVDEAVFDLVNFIRYNSTVNN